MISIAITVDVEWCPAGVIGWLLGQLDSAGVRATLFATDEPQVDYGGHEVGVHPNPFRPGSEGMLAEASRLKALYPEARGLRMHRLAWESGLEAPVAAAGFRYASTHMLPKRLVNPFRLSPHLLHFPIYYMDHHELVNRDQFNPPFSLASLELDVAGLYVFDFHPNLLFTNAPTEEFYRQVVHPRYKDEGALLAARYSGRGCFDPFRELLGLRAKGGVRFVTLSEAFEEHWPCGTDKQ